jgi:branched-chain amino acid transport system permease protein
LGEFLHQLASGLALGGVYATMALALVMIYQATHLINFAQGEMAMFSTYFAWKLMDLGEPYWFAFFATIVASFICGVVIERLVVRPFANAPILASVIVFIGLSLIFTSLAGWLYGFSVTSFDHRSRSALVRAGYMSSHEAGHFVTFVRSRWSTRFPSTPLWPRDAVAAAQIRCRAGWSAFGSDGCWRSAGAWRRRSGRSRG